MGSRQICWKGVFGRWLTVVACGLSVACARTAPHTIADRVLFTADADGAPSSVPFVEAKVGARPLLALLDTGAEFHFISAATAWERDVASKPIAFVGNDIHGAGIEGVELAAPGSMLVDALSPDNVLVIDSPNLGMMGIRAGISPQRWAQPERVVVVDGPAARLHFSEEMPELSGGSEVVLCREGKDPRDGFSLVTTMDIGGVSARVLLDTGSGTTLVSATTPAGVALSNARPAAGQALGGDGARSVQRGGATTIPTTMVGVRSESKVEPHPDTSVRLGGRRWRATIATSSRLPGACGTAGVVGWDLLRQCRLAIGPEGGALSCTADHPLSRRAPQYPEVPMALRSIRVASACGVDAFSPHVDVTLPHTFSSGDVLFNVIERALVDVAGSLKQTCHNRGWLDARPIRPFVHRQGTNVDALVQMDVGPRYRVGQIQVVDNDAPEDRTLHNELLAKLEVKSGASFDRALVARDMKRVRDHATDRRVYLVLESLEDTAKVNVTFRVQRISSDR